MDRCALFVDAGYVLADGAMAVHGTRRRESVSWDYAGLLQLLASLAVERSRLPLLRCYWYEATVEGRRSADHDALADLPGVKLRLAKMRPGRREGVEGEIHRDLTTLARNKAVSDAMVVSAEEDLAQVISDVQDTGMRVTLLNIAAEGGWTLSRALRQECDDIVEVSAAHLRPYVELISGAEPPRGEEGNGALVALRPPVNGHGPAARRSAGHPQPTAGPGAGQQQVSQPQVSQPQVSQAQVSQAQDRQPGYGAPPAAEYQAPPPRLLPGDQPGAADGAGQPEAPAAQRAEAGRELQARQDRRPPAAAPGPQDPGQPEAAGIQAERGASAGYPVPGEYGAAGEYGPAAGYGAVPDFIPAAYAPGAATAERERARQDPLPGRDAAIAPEARHGRREYGLRPGGAGGAQPEAAARQGQPSPPELAPRELAQPGLGQPEPPAPELAQPEPPAPELAQREEPYAAHAAIPVPAAGLAADRQSGGQRQDGDLSGYNPGAARDQFRADHIGREPLPADGDGYQPAPVPVPVGSAQVRRLPSRGPAAQVAPAGQLPLDHLPRGQHSGGQHSGGQPLAPAMAPGAPPEQAAGIPPGGQQPIAPVVPMDPAAMAYPDPRGASYAGPPPPGPAAQPGGPGIPPGAPGQPGRSEQVRSDQVAGQGGPASGPHPALSPVMPGGPAGQQDQGGPAGQPGPAYSGGQAAVSLADAVQSAHEEGQEFGESVARDAPALWLEAVLARKPRMPSDLEARLLQGSALPIDFLLHDEVRHALRRGFWDALERARR